MAARFNKDPTYTEILMLRAHAAKRSNSQVGLSKVIRRVQRQYRQWWNGVCTQFLSSLMSRSLDVASLYRSVHFAVMFDHRTKEEHELKQPSEGKQAYDEVDWSKVQSPDRQSQVALSVADMPSYLGELLDRSLEDHLRDS